MGKDAALPKRLNCKSAIKLLEANGWTHSTGGKHGVKMVKDGERPITLPTHRGGDWGPGLTNDILRQAGLKGGEGEDDNGSTSEEGE